MAFPDDLIPPATSRRNTGYTLGDTLTALTTLAAVGSTLYRVIDRNNLASGFLGKVTGLTYKAVGSFFTRNTNLQTAALQACLAYCSTTYASSPSELERCTQNCYQSIDF